MDMSLISGMPEVIAYIRSQDESIEALKAELDDVKEERDKYFGYLEDKDYECETQREYKEALEEENEKLKNTILSLKSSVDDLREARDMRDHQIEKLKEGKLSKFQCDKCKGHHTGCANPTCDSCVKEIEEENEKVKEELDTWHKALNEPVEGLENLQSGINLHFWQRCSGPWDDDIDKINQN